ncbi:hypothetical protein H5395_09725 [Paracoccus sp. MC1854]|uniref:hypothetical protein n=1 Tax=Paracoccus sp. MC1854 TaxID=2760306 RepID=UPI0016004F97|nr:hypothetical protein [Paracoccus sp. MC1854]MBB1491806.1 hypothetical protein [Paracoccus sp. MC1854]
MQRKMLAALAVAVLAGCGVTEAARQATTAPTIAPAGRPSITGWLTPDAQTPATDGVSGDMEWKQAALGALESEGVTLLSALPADVMQFCPGYARQTRENRAAFWAGLVSAIVERDARPEARERRLPLMQISLPDARANGCGGAMTDGAANARCAVRIMAQAVARDGAIAGRSGAGNSGWTGLARNWLPLRSDRQRGEIAGWTRSQSYCR